MSLKGIIAVLVGAALFSAKGPLVKMSYAQGADAMDMLGLRMLISMFICLPLVWIAVRNSQQRIGRKDIAALVGLSFLGFYLSSTLNFIGLQWVSAGMERMILFLYPSFVLALKSYSERKLPSFSMIAATVASYVGLGFFYLGEGNITLQNHWKIGVALVLASAITYAIYMHLSEPLVKRFGASLSTSAATLVAGSMVVGHYCAQSPHPFVGLNPQVYAYGAVLAIFGTVIPGLLVSYGVQIIGSAKTSLYSTIGPVATLAMGVAFLGESVTTPKIIGAAMVIGGSLMLGRK